MRRPLMFLLSLIIALPWAPSAVARTRKITFEFQDRDQLVKLMAGGSFEIVSVKGHTAEALETISPASSLTAASLKSLKVLTADIDRELDVFRQRGDVGKYHTVAQNEAELKAYAAQYPNLCHLESIGKTFEGRDLWALRITGAADTTKVPRMLIFGLTHAREWISAELPHFIIKRLLTSYATDASVKALVDSRCLWIMPVYNPDGLNYSQTNYTMWRKNRSNRSSSIGVDVNRNFEVGWGAGSSDYPGSDVFRGPHFNSEEETQALVALVQREKFNVTLSLHSYSELILYPWGYTDSDPPGKETLSTHGRKMADVNHYEPGSVAQILYTAGGATDDTFFSRYGCWSWTFELGTQFIPPDSQITSICELNWGAVLHLMQNADQLAANPPPHSARASVESRLSTLEDAWRQSPQGALSGLANLLSPEPAAGDTLSELRASIGNQLADDPALSAAIRERAARPQLHELYRPLLRQGQ
jgi:hypothetical protein